MFVRLRPLCGASTFFLAACTMQQTMPTPAATGAAWWAMKLPAASQHYQLAASATATGANLAVSVTPVYPTALLSACPPPQNVQALVIVDKLGKVSEIRVADEAQAGEPRRLFILATRQAVTQWRFNPLQVQHDGLDPAGDAVVTAETRSFSLTYVFRFACRAGKPVVSQVEREKSTS